ncbi:uncharacterized protein [Dermacentor albipictus]|uniref:uncharacterized protein isoform X2 n=1 Tax=Dermacentor albipictus TaxID=60249 RepID=UPI0031FE4099
MATTMHTTMATIMDTMDLSALLCKVANRRPTSAVNLPAVPLHLSLSSDLPAESLAAVVECVQQNVTQEVLQKLNRVSESVECDTILCGIRKFCERDGTLENNRTDIFTTEQNQELRVAFYGCRPQQVVTSEAPQEVSEVTSEA